MNLAVCCGPIVTTWDCVSDAGQANIHPRDDSTPVVDVSWNTSGQGMIEANDALCSTFFSCYMFPS